MVYNILAPWGKEYSVIANNTEEAREELWLTLVEKSPLLASVYKSSEFMARCEIVDQRRV